MARNYMQDIAPPEPDGPREPRRPDIEKEETAPLSIRDIRPSAARTRLSPIREEEIPRRPMPTPVRRTRSRGIWIAAAILIVVLGIAALLVLFPSTSVTIIPRTQIVTFDASMPLTAYPEGNAAAGVITYSVLQQSFDDSASVAANGTEHVEEQAKGKITVYNDTEKTVALIKNTRFQSPSGLIFRIPVSIDVPAKSGTGPGSLEVEIFADQAGPEYNVGPFEKLTLPGLKSSDMYDKVYGRSSAAFTGGFSGERPAVSESVLQAAQAEIRGRLQEKANQFAQTAPEGKMTFPGLLAVRFETLPPTEESGSVRINERVIVYVPAFSGGSIARAIAQMASASADGQSVGIRFSGVTGAPATALSGTDLGQQSFAFTLGGRGQLIWEVDGGALTEALAGREEAAFETVIASFPGIEEARARLMPFWRSRFPEKEDIRVIVEEPPQA